MLGGVFGIRHFVFKPICYNQLINKKSFESIIKKSEQTPLDRHSNGLLQPAAFRLKVANDAESVWLTAQHEYVWSTPTLTINDVRPRRYGASETRVHAHAETPRANVARAHPIL